MDLAGVSTGVAGSDLRRTKRRENEIKDVFNKQLFLFSSTIHIFL